MPMLRPAVLQEQQPSTGFQYPANFTKGGRRVGDGAQGIGYDSSVRVSGLKRYAFPTGLEALGSHRRARHLPLSDRQHRWIGINADELFDLAWVVVRQVQA